MSSVNTKIRLRDLRKSFAVYGRPVPVLREVEFHAREGELVGVIGPSGCGKSTLLNVIAGLEQPDGGTVELDGRPAPDRLGMVGYMQQKDLLMPWRSVLDNVVLGLEIAGVRRNEARRRARDLVDVFGLSGYEEQYPNTLSGGMRQRAAFLRTVLVERDVMLLDEPFGALDALTRTQMQEWLLGLWEMLGKTIVMVTHDVDEALLLSDRVYVLTPRPGTVKAVVEVGLPRPRYYGMITEPRFNDLKQQLVAHLHPAHLHQAHLHQAHLHQEGRPMSQEVLR
ncbi:MAG: ABC transporter ATP-binding protein [Dehalococcoidia bacterium]|nr:ABC transporter ATP-binding protein [Dehalococcoidia bacterium]